MKELDVFTDFLEWESFAWPLRATNIQCLKKLYNIPQSAEIEIKRDNQFKIIGVVSGETYNKNDLEYDSFDNKLKSGQFIEPENLVCYPFLPTAKYYINDFFISKTNFRSNVNENFRFTSDFFCTQVQEIIDEKKDCEKLVEFYLCGKTNFFFPRATKRFKETKYIKDRQIIDNEPEGNIIEKAQGSARDFMLIKTGKFNFIVQEVNAAHLPEWSNGIQIEYRKSFKQIPNSDIRKAVSEIISFVFGTHLLNIGSSHFDNNNNIIERRAKNPWGDNVVSKCSSSSLPPIQFSSHNDSFKIESILSRLVESYIEKRNKYNLSDVLWKYWIASELAVGTNLPILSSGLETLAESFIKHNNLIPNYSNIEKKVYTNLVKADLENLKEKVKTYRFGKSIINKIENPFSLGIGEKIKLFFDTINFDLPKNSLENEALRARNAMTHSKLEIDNKTIQKYIKLTRAYETLFHRTILKILDFDGKYIDYYSDDHPEQDIHKNIGEY